MQTEGFQTYNAILVTAEELTPMAKQALKLLTDSTYCVERFQDHELLIDITEHELVSRANHACASRLFGTPVRTSSIGSPSPRQEP